MSAKITEIRKRIAKATPGPWESDDAWCSDGLGGSKRVESFVHKPGEHVSIAAEIVDPVSGKPSEANAEFIANAPSDIAFLLAEIASLKAALELGQINCDAAYNELRAERDDYRSERARLIRDCNDQTGKIARLKAELEAK